jgi:hypothetical protein
MQKEITGTCSITAEFGPDAGLFERIVKIESLDITLEVSARIKKPMTANIIEHGNTVIATFFFDRRDLEQWFSIADREAARDAEQDAAEDYATRL